MDDHSENMYEQRVDIECRELGSMYNHLLKVTALQNALLSRADNIYAKSAYGGGPILMPNSAVFKSHEHYSAICLSRIFNSIKDGELPNFHL